MIGKGTENLGFVEAEGSWFDGMEKEGCRGEFDPGVNFSLLSLVNVSAYRGRNKNLKGVKLTTDFHLFVRTLVRIYFSYLIIRR